MNRSYEEMASHYRTAVLPPRPNKPRDKAKLEACVRLVTRWIIAKISNKKFFTLAELKEAVADCVKTLNAKVSRTSAPARPGCSTRSSGPRSSRCRRSPTSSLRGRR